MLDTDTFCPNCGEKVKKINNCPFCGAELREGIRFCPKCGREVSEAVDNAPEDDEIPVVKQMETKDIPFDDIEKNIIFEAAQQVKSRDYKSGNKKNHQHKITDDGTEKNNDVYEEIPVHPENDRYTETEQADRRHYESSTDNSYAGDGTGAEEQDEEDESVNTMKLPMIIVGILIIAVIAVLFIKMKGTMGGGENETNVPASSVKQTESTQAASDKKIIGQVEVVSDVNVRNKPSKDSSDVVDTAKTGEKFDYYGYGDDAKNWVCIKLSDGSQGYIYKDFVKIIK